MGFRKDRLTQLALLHMTESWRKTLDSNKFIANNKFIIFLDFRKAFDSLNYKVMKEKLKGCGVTGDLYDWIQNYLNDRQQITSVNGQSSEQLDIETGTPQGSIIGPQLFNMNMTSICLLMTQQVHATMLQLTA